MNYASIDSVLLRKPYLELVQGDLYDIASRIKSIEEGYFIVFNRRNNKYEVHSTFNRGWDTYCFTVPYQRLDARTLQLCRETNVAMRGDSIVKDMDEHNARLDESNQKNFRRTIEDASLETADMVAFGLEQDDLHEGYSKVHVMGGQRHES